MAKFYGAVGFVNLVETAPDVHTEVASEKMYPGEFIRQSYRSVASTASINDNIVMNKQIKIIADPYLTMNYPSIKYVHYKGANWKVSSIDDNSFPDLILTIGEVYNGQTPETE